MARRTMAEVAEEVLRHDLERYRRTILEMGAANAEIITADRVAIDERVRAKCAYPRCRHYGTNANCPPYSMDPEETRKLAGRFRYALFFRLRVPTEVVADKRGPEAGAGLPRALPHEGINGIGRDGRVPHGREPGPGHLSYRKVSIRCPLWEPPGDPVHPLTAKRHFPHF